MGRPTSNWSMRILADVFFPNIQQLIEFFIYFFNLSLKYIHFIFICLTTKTPYRMGDIQCPPSNWNGGYSMPSIQLEWGIFNALHPTGMGDIQCPSSNWNVGYSMPSNLLKWGIFNALHLVQKPEFLHFYKFFPQLFRFFLFVLSDV